MSEKITVRVSFKARATWMKDVEMTRTEYENYCAKLDSMRGAARQALEEDMAADLGFDFAEEPCFDDSELDDFYEEERK